MNFKEISNHIIEITREILMFGFLVFLENRHVAVFVCTSITGENLFMFLLSTFNEVEWWWVVDLCVRM